MKMPYLFLLFLLSPPGKLRVKRWRAFRAVCLKRAHAGQKRAAIE